jgi:hypothetical protein
MSRDEKPAQVNQVIVTRESLQPGNLEPFSRPETKPKKRKPVAKSNVRTCEEKYPGIKRFITQSDRDFLLIDKMCNGAFNEIVRALQKSELIGRHIDLHEMKKNLENWRDAHEVRYDGIDPGRCRFYWLRIQMKIAVLDKILSDDTLRASIRTKKLG